MDPDVPARAGAPPPEPDQVPSRPPPGEPIGPIGALLRHPWLALLVVLACTGAGVAAGLQRTPSYSTQAQLNLGGTDVQSQALPGYVSAVQSLAGSYSRAIDSAAVVEPVAERVGLEPGVVRARISASPIPDSSVIQVGAVAPSEREAVRLANGASDSLIAYVRDLGGAPSSGRSLLRDYRDAELEVSTGERKRERLSRRYDNSPSAELAASLRDTEADLAADRLRARTLAKQYQTGLETQPSKNFIRVLTPAGAATSDRLSQLKLLGFSGLVAGLVLAAALTMAVANRRRLRRGG